MVTQTKVGFILSILFTLIILCTSASGDPVEVYDVVKLGGAKPDGKTDSTTSFLNAWAIACASINPITIYVPPGSYFLETSMFFHGQCNNTNITFLIQGILVAPSDYNIIGNSKSWLSFKLITGVSIYGGILNGRGVALWACKRTKKTCPQGAAPLTFTNSKDIVIDGLKSLNSQMFHIVINDCQNVSMRGVMVTAPGDSPNTDGIHIQLSTGVAIIKSGIKTGDDCISIGHGTKNLWIQNIACGPEMMHVCMQLAVCIFSP